MRKTIRNKGHFPSDDAAIKLIYLSLREIEAKWKRLPREWQAAKVQLAIQFGEWFTLENRFQQPAHTQNPVQTHGTRIASRRRIRNVQT